MRAPTPAAGMMPIIVPPHAKGCQLALARKKNGLLQDIAIIHQPEPHRCDPQALAAWHAAQEPATPLQAYSTRSRHARRGIRCEGHELHRKKYPAPPTNHSGLEFHRLPPRRNGLKGTNRCAPSRRG